uniref:Uncharacterized protein n=1 Tax=Podoviridae sp. ctJDl18 TaxID=2825242 RepID=A0A8S5V0L2_9CAUD|nr:MAG TPA: hypothetical protein [Podoviridae sp. ctJDl18]
MYIYCCKDTKYIRNLILLSSKNSFLYQII